MSEEEKKQSALDKIVMGAIIGTAIGSAVGASMAKKPGSETRQMIKEKATEWTSDTSEIRTLTKETTKGFFTLFNRLFRWLFSRKKTRAVSPTSTAVVPPEVPSETSEIFKEIPVETDIIPQ